MKALIITDVQNDFMPGGSLAVEEGDKIVPLINELMNDFELVVATQDWHPQDHISFASNHKNKQPFDKIQWQGMEQVLWPDHCVQLSKGAEFHPGLNLKPVEAIFRKGMDKEIDSYSVFFDNLHKKDTGLAGYLRRRNATELYFCGLAADVCVQYSIKDAIKEGFKTYLFQNATKAIDEDEWQNIKAELKEKGCSMVS